MIVIADANIVISAIINPQGKIATLLSAGSSSIEFIIPQFTLSEIKKHKERICAKGKISAAIFDKLLNNLLSNILIINDEEILLEHIDKALLLTKYIDTNDTLYIALSIGLDVLMWTGDLKLHHAMRRQKFLHTITTNELESIIKGL